MINRKNTCGEGISKDLAGIENWLAAQYKLIDAAEVANDFERAHTLREEVEPYSVSTIHRLKLELLGGASSWLEVELGKARWGFYVASVVYHFVDGCVCNITESEAPGLWRLAEYYAESADSTEYEN